MTCFAPLGACKLCANRARRSARILKRRRVTRRRAQLWLAMQPSFLNPLGMDIASSAAAIDELFDEVLPVEGDPQEGVPAASPAAVLVHKELWDTFLADDLIAPGAPSGISSQFSDDALPLRASFCGTRRPEDPSPSLKPSPNSILDPLLTLSSTLIPSRWAPRA